MPGGRVNIRRLGPTSRSTRAVSRVITWVAAGWELARPQTLALPAAAVVATVVAAGARSGGLATLDRGRLVATLPVALAALTMVTLNAASNVLNQVFDIEADRINKPWRPLPAGRVTSRGVLGLATGLYALALGGAWLVGPPAGAPRGGREFFGLTLMIALATIAYSVPPVRTKRSAWAAQATIALARGVLLTTAGWSCGATVCSDTEPWCLGVVFGLFLLGASATKDFSDVNGDAATGCATLPVRYGPRGAAVRVCPFFVAPWLLLTSCAWLKGPDGRPLIDGDPVVLTVLGVALAAAGASAAADLREGWAAGFVGRGAENHPAWRQMYRMTALAYLGITVAYIVKR